MTTTVDDPLGKARALARHADAVRRALGNEANDAAWASERARLVEYELPTFNALMALAGRPPVEDAPGGVDALRAIGLATRMAAAADG